MKTFLQLMIEADESHEIITENVYKTAGSYNKASSKKGGFVKYDQIDATRRASEHLANIMDMEHELKNNKELDFNKKQDLGNAISTATDKQQRMMKHPNFDVKKFAANARAIKLSRSMTEGWNPFSKKEKSPPPPSRFPSKGKETEWMDAKVAHVKATNPKELHALFSPASGDYLPQSVHVGSSWKNGSDIEKHYRKIKSDHPEAVAKAKTLTKTAGRFGMSRVGDDQDYHGVEVLP